MKKIDIHLHLTLQQYPKTDTMFLSSAAQMLPHLEELGIEQGIVLSSGEQEMSRSWLQQMRSVNASVNSSPRSSTGCAMWMQKTRQMCINGS